MNITQRPRRPPRSSDVEGAPSPITSPDASIDREAPLASPSKRKRPPPRSAAGGVDCIVHMLRKFATAFFGDIDDDALKREDVTRIDVLAALLKEVAISCLIAFAILTALLFVGRYFHVVHIPIAHKYERAVVHLLYDESVMQSFEEDGLTLMPLEEYTYLKEEINNAAGKIKMEEEVLEARTRALEEARKEGAEIEVEYPKLFGALNLDHFCADCKWSGGQTCLVRAAYLEEKYQTPKFRAMLSAMEKESCWKSAEQLEQDKRNRGLEEKLLAERARENDFCSDCDYDRSTTCHVRACFLGHWYGLVAERARARVMAEALNCRLSHHK